MHDEVVVPQSWDDQSVRKVFCKKSGNLRMYIFELLIFGRVKWLAATYRNSMTDEVTRHKQQVDPHLLVSHSF